MRTKRDIRSYSIEDLKGMVARGQVLGKNRDAPPRPIPKSFWKHARVVMPAPRGKVATNLRIDRDVWEWFKGQGPGHLARMNAVLRSYYEASKDEEAR